MSAGDFSPKARKGRRAFAFHEGGELERELLELAGFIDAGIRTCLLLATYDRSAGARTVIDSRTRSGAATGVSVHRGGRRYWSVGPRRLAFVDSSCVQPPIFQAGGLVAYRRALRPHSLT